MAKKVVWAVIFAIFAALLQSTLFSRLSLYFHAVPDLALGIIVYSAYVNGTMTGQLSGFCSGFFLDFLSAAPLGFNALIRTIVGALAGLMKGTFFLDFIFLPMALCAGATVVKALMYLILNILLAGTVPAYSLFHITFWMELIFNTVSAPLLFAFLKLFEPMLVGRRGN
jgi:rod shape-determining protein MreD